MSYHMVFNWAAECLQLSVLPVQSRLAVGQPVSMFSVDTFISHSPKLWLASSVVCFVNQRRNAEKFIFHLVSQIHIAVVSLVRAYKIFRFVIGLEGLNGVFSSSLLKYL